MNNDTLLITGASGQLGQTALERLLKNHRGKIIATTRKPEALASFAARGVEVRKADFDDASTLRAAFAGAKRALLISTDALDRPGRRFQQHQRAIQAMEAAGVEHAVYTSLANAYRGSPITIVDDHLDTEAALQASKLDFTILRNNLYLDLLLGALPGVLASGELVDARGTGATAFITREDCALVAAAALMEPTRGRRVLEITGSAALTSADVAAILSELANKPIRHVSVPGPALVQGLVQHGFPEPVAQIFASFDAAIQKGDLAAVHPASAQLLGRPTTSVRAFLTQHLQATRVS